MEKEEAISICTVKMTNECDPNSIKGASQSNLRPRVPNLMEHCCKTSYCGVKGALPLSVQKPPAKAARGFALPPIAHPDCIREHKAVVREGSGQFGGGNRTDLGGSNEHQILSLLPGLELFLTLSELCQHKNWCWSKD